METSENSLALTGMFVLHVVHTMTEPPLLVCNLSCQWVILASLWVSIVLYFSDNSLSQGFFYIYNRLKKWYYLFQRRFWK